MKTLYRTHPSLRSFFFASVIFKGVLFSIVFGGIAVGLSYAGVYSNTLGYLLAAVLVLLSAFGIWAVRKSITYTITSSAIRVDSGIIRRKREEFGVKKVQSIDVEQNLIERFILKTGDVSFDSAAGSESGRHTDVLFRGVVNPHRVADIARNADEGSYIINNYSNSSYTPPSNQYPSQAPSQTYPNNQTHQSNDQGL